MFGLGTTEMILIGIVALIVIGPKDLPGLFRQVGQFVGKAKGMAREFSSAMNAAADEAGVSEINKTIKAAANPQKFGVDKIREASGMSSPKVAPKVGSETEALKSTLSAERAANKEKIDKAMAQAAKSRIASEKAQAAAEAASVAKSEAAKATPKKATTKKAAPKKTTVKKPAAKKTPAKKPAAKKTTPKAETPSKDAT